MRFGIQSCRIDGYTIEVTEGGIILVTERMEGSEIWRQKVFNSNEEVSKWLRRMKKSKGLMALEEKFNSICASDEDIEALSLFDKGKVIFFPSPEDSPDDDGNPPPHAA